MPNPLWPAELPQAFPLGVPKVRQDLRVISEVDVGAPQVRLRGTGATTSYGPMSFVYTDRQVAALELFVETTLRGGTQRFDWISPWPYAGRRTFQFADLPKLAFRGGDPRLHDVTFSLLEPPPGG